MRVLYYYYYIFYKKILREGDPHFYAKVGISGTFSFTVATSIAWIMGGYCYDITKLQWMSIAVIVLFLVFLYFKGKGEKIVASKPQFFRSSKLSLVFSIAFFLMGMFFLIAGPIVGKLLHQKCH